MLDKLRRNKNQLLVIMITFVFAITLVATALILSKADFTIKDYGTGTDTEGKFINTISVSGDGKVYAKPDMAELRISVEETESTSKEALEKTNTRVDTIIKVLKDKGIDEEDIQTTGFNIYPEYKYNDNDRELIGYRASQTMNVTIKKIGDDAKKVSETIDAVAEVDNTIQIENISFDIEDKQAYFAEARELAFGKAKQKAEELSNLAGTELGKPVSMSDVSVDYSTTSSQTNTAYLEKAASDSVQAPTAISTGQMELTIRINVSFGIE